MASVEPDLDVIKSDVLALLSRLPREALRESQSTLGQFEQGIATLNRGKELSQYSDLANKVHGKHSEIKKALGQPSYSDCIKKYAKYSYPSVLSFLSFTA